MGLGNEFGPYRLGAEVGRGGMGVVYRATHVGSGRAVALKVMLDPGQDRTFRDRFIRESRITSSIDHPNVIKVFETGEYDGRLFIAMSFVEGSDLAQIIAASPSGLDVARAVRLVSQAAAALDAAHVRGLVHRDVKPANILVSGPGEEHVYLTDFGLTRMIDGATQLTSVGKFVGTVAYCAPEQITGARVGPATDIYALGCVLFHAVTGRLPFERDSEMALMYAQVNDPIPDLATLAPHAPAPLAAVVARALAKSPGERYASAGELARAAATLSRRRRCAVTHPGRRRRATRLARRGDPAPWQRRAPAAAERRRAAARMSCDRTASGRTGHARAGARRRLVARCDASRGASIMALVLSLIVATGFLLFAAAEADREASTPRTRLASFERVSPAAAAERRREARSGAARELVDDANDILLKPFSAIVDSGDRWAQRAVPTGLALLVYGVMLVGLGRMAGRWL